MLLVVCLVDVMLLQARPCSNHAPLQISDVEYGPAVDTHLVMPQTLSSTGFRSGVYSAATDWDSAVWCRIYLMLYCTPQKSLLVFTRYNTNILNWDEVCCLHVFASNSLGLCFYQELAKLDDLWQSYHKHRRVTFFSETRCMCLRPSYCQWASFLHCTKKTARLSPLRLRPLFVGGAIQIYIDYWLITS